MANQSSFSRFRSYLGSLFTNMYLWIGLALLVGLALAAYLLINNVIMPSYTRHDASVTVPSVKHQSFEEAAQQLRSKDLRVEKDQARYSPGAPTDVVIEQTPPSSSVVKPGRRIYLTVNTGQAPMVQVPPVEDLSLREAQNRVMAIGLKVKQTKPDSIPAPYKNTVTRQQPAPGDSLQKGAGVSLWYSTGLGDKRVELPDVTGQTVAEARESLLKRKLRAVVVNKPEENASEEEIAKMRVQRQSRKVGTRVRQGFEVRLFLKEKDEDKENTPSDTP